MARPKRTYKSLDDDVDVTNILEVVENIDKIDGEGDEPEENLITDDAMIEDDIIEKDDVKVWNTGEDMTVSVTSVHINLPAPKLWSDDIKTKFSIGDLVYFVGCSDNIYKVTGPCKTPYTYALKPSGCDSARYDVAEEKLKKAKSGAVWVDYWDTVVDPYREWKRKQDEAAKTKDKAASKNKKK